MFSSKNQYDEVSLELNQSLSPFSNLKHTLDNFPWELKVQYAKSKQGVQFNIYRGTVHLHASMIFFSKKKKTSNENWWKYFSS